jgi:ATP-dependent DNA ligase
MALALRPPLRPMLARLVRELPRGAYAYEPKWDGFRALAFRDGDAVELQSRHGRPLGRYFPELAEALRSLPDRAFVLDGEVLVALDGRFDFVTLMARLHPAASRVERLAAEAPAFFIAFDLLAVGAGDLTETPFERRRARLEALLSKAPSALRATPLTRDPALAAAWLGRFAGGGVDGVVAKALDGRYEPGRRAMLKVKTERTAETVVAGFRWLAAGEQIGSLLLGLYDDDAALRHVGVSSSFTREARDRLAETLTPLVTPIEGHPWERGFGLGRSPLGRLLGAAGRWDPREMPLDWVPVRPELVCEVAYDQVDEGRFRHPARFRRWRPDREPGSCRLEQLEAAGIELPALLTV